MRRLTLKQELFVTIYLKTLNGTEAAYRSYNCKTRASASQIAYNLLRNVEIFSLIRSKLTAEGMSLDSILESAINSLVEIAKQHPEKINASDSIRANQLLLKLSGYL